MLKVAQQVDRYDDADHEVVHAAEHGVHARGDVGDQAAEARQEFVADPGDDVRIQGIECAADIGVDLRIVDQQTGDPLGEIFRIGRRFLHDGLDAVVQLRQDHIYQGDQHREQHQHRDQHRERPGELAPVAAFVFGKEFPAQRAENLPVQQAHQRQQQVGQYQAPDEGAENTHDLLQRLAEQGDVVERHIKEDRCGDHKERRHAPVQIFFVPVKLPSHSGLLSQAVAAFLHIILLLRDFSVNIKFGITHAVFGLCQLFEMKCNTLFITFLWKTLLKLFKTLLCEAFPEPFG